MSTPTLDRPIDAAAALSPETTMKAVVQDAYGAAPEDVLRLAEIDRPTVGDGEVLVRVRAASVDRGTVHLMTGLPSLMRGVTGLRRPKALNPGRCLAGVVETVGAGVAAFRPGDEVYGTCTGSFAEYAAVQPELLAAKPANLSFEQAAAMPISAVTALQAVRDVAHVTTGQRVLIIGASGGVGTFAVQIAKAFGAEVTGVSSTAKLDLVLSIGADHVVDYTLGDVLNGEDRYDVILDIGGNSRPSHLRRALTPHGRIVMVGGETDGRFLGGFGRQLRAQMGSPFHSHKTNLFMAKENAKDLIELRELVESGRLTPVIDRSYPIDETATAIRHVLDGHTRGKVVISV